MGALGRGAHGVVDHRARLRARTRSYLVAARVLEVADGEGRGAQPFARLARLARLAREVDADRVVCGAVRDRDAEPRAPVEL